MKKTLVTLLLIAMLCQLLAACSSSKPSNSGSATTASDSEAVTSEVTEAETEQLQPNIPETDLDGYVFRIMGKSEEAGWKWEAIDIFTEAENGEPINDAVYTRNRMLDENLNVKIEAIKNGDPAAKITQLILAGEDGADIVTAGINALANMVKANNLVAYNDVPYIDFDAVWWDKNMINELSIMDNVYLMTGDITIMDDVGTWVIAFNKPMIEDYSLDDPYETVKSGAWTYDKLLSMMSDITRDLDGDGEIGDFDQRALLGEAYNTYVFLAGSGERIANKDENDLPYLSIYNDRAIKAVEKTFEIMNNDDTTLISTRVKNSYTQVFDECIIKNFGEGRALLYLGSMKAIESLRSYDTDFGLIPTPKLDEQQDRYYTSMSCYNCNAYSIPKSNTDLERTGIVMEAMAAYSKYTLTPAYHDVTLVGKSLRDDVSEEMLNLVMDSRLYDLCMIFDWGGIFSTITSMATSHNSDFVSMYSAREKSAETAIQKFIDDLKEYN